MAQPRTRLVEMQATACLLLDSTLSYHQEVQRTQGQIPESVKNLLLRLRAEETEVLIVSLAEATPFYMHIN